MIPENHKKLGVEACLPLLKQTFPNENLGYFLLGNWFTDMSQGIAPVDYAATMTDARNEGVDSAKKDSWFLRYLVPDFIIHYKANQFVRELVGSPPPKDSAMAEWFKNAAYVAGWIEFCYKSGPAGKLEGQGAGPIDFDEYDRIFNGKKSGKSKVKGRYSQYFPHEHFDRWPMDRTEKSERKVYKYIEDHIQNIAELLTLVERDLAKIISEQTDKNKEKFHDMLAEFGYALHTAEDYWAHTNYVDFAMHSIGDIPGDPKQHRIHERRLLRDKTPRTKMFTEPGETEDETHVVGGYFDGVDTRFSLTQIYTGMKEKLQTGNEMLGVSRDYIDWRNQKTHNQRVRYKNNLKVKQDRLGMPQKVRDAELAFIQLDWKMMDDWDGKCVSWVLEKMLKEGKEYGDKTFNADDGHGGKVRYAERVGSHSLIAKDDKTKQPGFEYAMNLAKLVDEYIMKTMLRGLAISEVKAKPKAKTTIKVKKFVDWVELLQYFMGHPDEAPKEWWKSAMKSGSGDHEHQLKFIENEEMNERAKLNTRARLEEEHNSMIRMEDAKYEKERHTGDEDTLVEELSRDESKRYLHEDMDFGSVRVTCDEGKIKIELSAAVWSKFEHIAKAEIGKGDTWSGDFKELSSVYDQDNLTVVTALSPKAKYKIWMVSYDR